MKHDGRIANASGPSSYSGAYDQLCHIRNPTSNEFIRNQAKSGLEAASSAAGNSYRAGTNVSLQTLKNISGVAGAPLPPPPKPAPKGDITLETTIKQ